MSDEVNAGAVLEAIRGIVEESKPGVVPSQADTFARAHLTEDVGFDSLDLINLLFRLEEEFGVKVPEADIEAENLLIAGGLADYVAGRAGSASSK